MEVRFEAWTRPESGSFTRLFPIRDVTHWQLQLGMFGHGSITLPSDSRVDDILYVDPADHSNDVASLIRAYVGDVHLYDFYAARATIMVDETGVRQATITGGGPGTALDRVATRQFDYDTNPSIIPDWVYGPANSVLTNPGFEDGPPDEDFEDLDAGGWTELSGYGPDGVAWEELDQKPVTSTAEAEAGAVSLLIGFGDAPSGASKTISVEPGGRIQISYKFKEPTTGGDRYLMFAAIGQGGTIHSANGWIYNGSAFVELDAAVRGAGATDGTWQDFDMDITVGDEQTSLEVGVQCTGTGDMPTGYLDTGVYTGDGLGISPWYSHRNDFQTMELDTGIVHSGTYSLEFQTTSMADDDARDGPSQDVLLTPGVQYNLSAWVYQASGITHYFRLGLKRYESGWDAGLNDVAVPTATWTQLTTNGVATQVANIFTVRWVNATGGPSASPVFWVDDCAMGEGQEASTIGEIWGDLIDDAATGHTPDRTALDWLTKDFTDSVDSDAAAWDQDISLTVARGQPYRRVFEFHTGTFGYEGRIRPDPADHTDLQFQLYNPGTMGTDYTATDGTAILRQGVVSVGPILRREPSATYAMVEGAGQWYGEDRDTGLETVWGEIETYQGSEEMEAASLDGLAANLTTGVETETLAVKFQAPPLVPGVDYLIGDTMQVTLGVVPSAAYRVAAISVSSGDPEPLWQVQFIPA